MSIIRTITYALLFPSILIGSVGNYSSAQPRILNAPSVSGDRLGTTLALSENWLVASAPRQIKDFEPSSVFVFEKSGTGWLYHSRLFIPNERRVNLRPFRLTLAGRELIVGVPYYTDHLDRAGAVLITRLPASGWEQTIEPEPPGIGRHFGLEVAFDGQSLLIGSSVYSFEFDPVFAPLNLYTRSSSPSGSWQFVSRMVVPRSVFDSGFGESLSLSGSVAAVGSPVKGPYLENRGGFVHIFEAAPQSPTEWKLIDQVTALDDAAGNEFGKQVILRNGSLIVGAPGASVASPHSGAVYVFEPNVASGTWNQVARISAPDGAVGDDFGTSLALNEHYLAIGAPGDDGTARNSGSVYIFERDTRSDAWTFKSKLKPPTGQAEQYFGQALALSGHELIVAAPGYLDESGILFAFNLEAEQESDPFTYDALLETAPVSQIWQDNAGFLWAGTWNGLIRYDGYSPRVYRHQAGNPHSISHSGILSMLQDSRGLLWIGTENGLNRFDFQHDRIVRYPISHDTLYPRQSFVTIFEDKNGTVWTGTNGRIYYYEPDQDRFVEYVPFTGLPEDVGEPYISGIQQDSLGRLWVLTKNLWELQASLYQINLETEAIARFRISPAWGQVGPLHIDSRNRIWIKAPQPIRFSVDSLDYLEAPSQVDLTPHWGFFEDEDGTLWIGTEHGFYHLGPDQDMPTLHKPIPSAQFRDSPNWVLSFYRDRTHSLLLGTFNGLFRAGEIVQDASAAESPKQRFLSPVSLTSIEVTNQEGSSSRSIYDTSILELSYRDYNFSLEFAALDFITPDQIRYRYQLEGYDRDWIASDQRRFAMYTNVPSGSYTFRVEAEREDGSLVGNPLAFPVTISPPFWQATWFRFLLIVCIIGLLSVAYRTHVNRLLKTERIRNLSLEKLRSEAEARRLAELDEMKSRFFANITHEFRTPLTLIIGPLEDGLKGAYGTIPTAFRERLAQMLQSSEQLLKLINQLLDLSKLEADTLKVEPVPLELAEALRLLTRSFQPLAEHNEIRLEYRSHLDTFYCRADLEKISTIVGNLISNALKFTPTGGKVWVTLDELKDGTNSVVQPFRTIRIIVKDTGPGIAQDDLSRIFDRFERADPDAHATYEGTGIGLSLARELTQLLSGQLLVESEPGFGTAFTVRLPLETVPDEALVLQPDPEDETSVGSSDPTVTPSLGTSRGTVEDKPIVLLVEDHPEVRALIRSQLEAHFQILEAENGREALALARRRTPDLVLSDVMMPEMDGLTLCETIKSDPSLSAVPVVLLSAWSEAESTIKGLEVGADDYIPKPYNSDTLRSRLTNLIETRNRLRSQFSREIVLKPDNAVITTEDEAFLDELLKNIQEGLSDPTFNNEQLADALGLSTRQLHRKVHLVTGRTPGQLIRTFRLQTAQHLLAHRPGSISEVSYSVGFKSASHFSAAFKEAFGCTPSDYVASLT